MVIKPWRLCLGIRNHTARNDARLFFFCHVFRLSRFSYASCCRINKSQTCSSFASDFHHHDTTIRDFNTVPRARTPINPSKVTGRGHANARVWYLDILPFYHSPGLTENVSQARQQMDIEDMKFNKRLTVNYKRSPGQDRWQKHNIVMELLI